MPFSLSLKSLIRLQKRQLLAGKTKRDLIGPLIMLVYMWGLEIVVFFVAKEEAADLDIPSLVLLIACAGLLIFDFIYKLIFVRDHTVVDAFLKNREAVEQIMKNKFEV
jgi:ABC-type antimicrobial peptide transport system permease subunit